ncbi:hypothetical protein [Bradyrhizobium sp.]|uniref:hypothetical protein n=1 Tax=Bradyrhizobium sp. TaxID=376 RepID=UPI003C6A6849
MPVRVGENRLHGVAAVFCPEFFSPTDGSDLRPVDLVEHRLLDRFSEAPRLAAASARLPRRLRLFGAELTRLPARCPEITAFGLPDWVPFSENYLFG